MKKLSILCLLAAFVASCTGSQQTAETNKQEQQPMQEKSAHEKLEFPELDDFQKPEVKTFTTENGIKFFLVEDDELPLINLSANIRTGGVQVPNKKAGLASITGTVIRSGGTKTYPADSLNAMLENNAASIETGIGFTSGRASMDVLKKDFDTLLPVFVDVLTNPAFPKEKIKLAKTQTKSGISRRNDDTQQIGFREFDRLIYGKNSVYGRNTEYATINNISRKDLVNFHDNNFVAENMMIGVVGDFNATEMKQKLRKAFGDIPEGNQNNLDFPEVNYEWESTINFINKSDVNQSFVLIGHLGGMRDNPDYAKIQVMNRVLSGGFSGRLMQVVRTEMGLAYSVFGQYGMNSFYPGNFYAGVMTKSSTTAKAIDAIIKQIERLQNEPITKKELRDTKDQILNSSVFEYDSYEEVLSQQMSYDYRGLPSDAFEQYIEGVKKTTIEDVQNVAQEYLNPENLQILVVGNKDEIGDQLQKYGDVNTIDISIPEPGSGDQKMVKGDAAKGKQLLNKMADAVISPSTDLNTLTVSGEATMQGRKMPMTMTVDYPDAIQQTIEGPTGEVKLNYKGGSGTMVAGGQERPLPPAMAKGLKSTLNKSFVSIALNANEVNPQFLGTEKVEGTTYNKLNVTVDGSNVTLLLDRETNYPDIIRYKQFNPQAGSQITIENRNSNWKVVDGVAYPYSQVTMQNGNKASSVTYKSHEVNK
ncbi:putative Zn-dependent peptidase [Fodinibius salinus]|uniref:Putative Zn-dependent peptidase n=1 Tax=Fodinibius salinus TaxID=860790 RepID=A0A5D3YEQ4_9BACT|nr:pitrilysin family protein [Fodinibius salinus]TYP91937.1 putative Zn-dependent peptidase [Fodinibius salinus]